MFISPPSAAISSAAASLLLASAADGLILFDDALNITGCNPAALRLVGRPVETLIGRPIQDVVLGIAWDRWRAQQAGMTPDAGDVGRPLWTAPTAQADGEWSAHALLDASGETDGGFCLHYPAWRADDRLKRKREIERLRDFVESASDWFWETDAELRYSYFSERYREATGVAPESRIGRRRGDYRLEGSGDGDWHAHLADLAARRPFRDFVFAYVDAEGQRRVAKVSGRPVFNDRGHFSGYRGVGRDITAEIDAEQRIHYLAQHDPLTALPNRMVLKDRLEQLLLRANRCDEGVAVLCVDLDDFKAVNDTLGHSAGDTLLCDAASRMRETVREMDTVARLGGDEFTVIQVNTHRCDDAETLAVRLIAALSQPFVIDGEQIHCGASIGISIYPNDGVSANELMRNADLALYKAKSCGGNTYRFYTVDMDREVQERRQLEKELRDALAHQSFCLHFQPQIDIASGSPVGCEALVRWLHPQRGVVSPGTFIQAAERSGLIVAIDRWVLYEACRQAKAWKDADLRVGRIAVNLSAGQLRRGDVVAYLQDVLTETGVSPADLEIEITESVLLLDTETVVATLNAINDLGVSLSVDDFGTGYSSLSYLRRFPVQKVKIDQSFIRNLPQKEDDRAIAGAIVSLGHSLGLQVVAEGVESADQLQYLREIGCDQAQGYFFARPLPAADYAAWFTRFSAGQMAARQDAHAADDLLPRESARFWLGHVLL